MPVPLIIAGVGAAAKVGAKMSEAKAMRLAAEGQERTAQAALAHEREREAIGDKRIDSRHQEYLAYVADWKARHGQGAPAGGGMGSLTPQAALPPGQLHAPGPSAASAAAGPGTLQDLAGAAPMGMGPIPDQVGSMADASTGQGRTLQDLSEWNDWRTHGLGA